MAEVAYLTADNTPSQLFPLFTNPSWNLSNLFTPFYPIERALVYILVLMLNQHLPISLFWYSFGEREGYLAYLFLFRLLCLNRIVFFLLFFLFTSSKEGSSLFRRGKILNVIFFLSLFLSKYTDIRICIRWRSVDSNTYMFANPWELERQLAKKKSEPKACEGSGARLS